MESRNENLKILQQAGGGKDTVTDTSEKKKKKKIALAFTWFENTSGLSSATATWSGTPTRNGIARRNAFKDPFWPVE